MEDKAIPPSHATSGEQCVPPTSEKPLTLQLSVSELESPAEHRNSEKLKIYLLTVVLLNLKLHHHI